MNYLFIVVYAVIGGIVGFERLLCLFANEDYGNDMCAVDYAILFLLLAITWPFVILYRIFDWLVGGES